MKDYGERLEHAIKLAKTTRAALAKHLGTSPQSVNQVILGDSKALAAGNHSKAARVLGVDDLWLATGEGDMPREIRPMWPFNIDSYQRLARLKPEDVGYIAGRLISAIEEKERGNAEPTYDKEALERSLDRPNNTPTRGGKKHA